MKCMEDATAKVESLQRVHHRRTRKPFRHFHLA